MMSTNDSYPLSPCPPPLDLEYLRAVEGTLSEWLDAADEDAYRGLQLPRQPGSARGQIRIADDFEAPLCDFDEYA